MLQVYKNQNMGQAQLNAPQMRQISTGGVAGLMPTDNIAMGKKAMGAIFDAMAERQRVQDNTDLAAASSELQKQVIAFQSQYRQQNMGRDARDAGDVWAQNVGELAGKIGEQFQGRPDLQARFKQAANEMALRSYASGFSYADGEEAKYRDATREEKLAILNDAIGNGTPMDIASAKQDYEATLALLYPGRNLQPELMAADRLVAGGLIDRALAENDIREARALYKEQRDQLGKDAPSYLSKIDAKAEALERKWEANRNKAGKAIMEGYADAEYKAKNMGDVSTLEGMAAELGKLGLADEAEKCRNAAETWRGMEDVSKLSLPELAQKIESATGSMKAEKDVDAHRRLSTQTKAMLDVYNHRLKALNADPALAADTAPDITLPDQPSEADKFAARMEWQKKNGVPADMAAPLTKSEAGYLGQQYTQSAQPVQFLAEMRTTYGDMYWPVLKQLVTSGAVPPTANLVADMEPEAGQYLAQASRKDYEKETETALGIEKADKNAMKASLQEHLAESIGTLAASGDAAAGSRILDAGYRLALRYRELGMDADDATEKAAQDVFASRYTVRGSYRVPKRFNDDDVDAGAQAYVENLDTSDILVGLSDEAKAMKPEALALLMRRTIALSGRWVTNRDESGLILTVGGAPVRLKSGGRVEVTFEELEHLGLTGSEE